MEIIILQGKKPVAKDVAFAEYFWATHQQVPGLRDAMKEIIVSAERSGKLTIIGDRRDDSTKARLSAYRQLANEMGYSVGEYQPVPSSRTVTAKIKRL